MAPPSPKYEGEHIVKVEKLDDGWHASCTCGWLGNNPVDDEADSQVAAEYHTQSIIENATAASEAGSGNNN